MRYGAIASPQPAQRKILNHGNTGRESIDHQRAATYSAIQTMKGEAIRADMTSAASTLDPSMRKTVSFVQLLLTEQSTPKECKQDAY
jgi:hypothetical protein